MNPGVAINLDDQSNEDLVLLVQRNPALARRAFDELYRRFRPELVAFLVYLGATPASAEDVFQDVALWLWTRRIADFRGGRFAPWLRTVAWRRHLDTLREHRREETGSQFDDHPSAESPVLENIEAGELAEAVQIGMSEALEEPERAVLQATAFEGVASAEVARTLGLSIDDVYRIHFRARTKLREYLAGRGFEIR